MILNGGGSGRNNAGTSCGVMLVMMLPNLSTFSATPRTIRSLIALGLGVAKRTKSVTSSPNLAASTPLLM